MRYHEHLNQYKTQSSRRKQSPLQEQSPVPFQPPIDNSRSSNCQAQSDDRVCRKVMDYCQTGWPQKAPPDPSIGPYWRARDSLSVQNNLLMFNLCIVIPLSLQQETLQKVNEGHKSIVRSRMRTKTSVWWPGISKHVSDFIQNCPVCAQDTEPQKEPLIMTPLPDYPWQMVGSDLF